MRFFKQHVEFLCLLALILLAFALRLDLLIANNFVIDSDEAIVGLMAKHITEGKGIPVFYYGQHYMGSLEALGVALLFKCFGISTVALKAVPLFFSLLLIPLIYALGKEVGGKIAATLSALLCAVPTSALLVWSSMARGGFIEIVFIGALSLLLCCKWLKQNTPAKSLSFFLGAVLGLGWWVNNQIIYFIVPIAFFLLARLLGDWQAGKQRSFFHFVCILFSHLISGLAGFFVGGLPFWLYNLQHDFASFEIFGHAPKKKLLSYLAGLFSQALPILFGGKRFWHDEDVFPASTIVVAVLYAAMLLCLVFVRRSALAKLFRWQIDAERPVELFLMVVLFGMFVFSFSSYGWLVQAPRYLLPIYVGVFVLNGVVLEELFLRWRRLGKILAVVFLAALIGLRLTSSYFGGRAVPGEPVVYDGQRVAKDHSELIQWLEQNNIRWVRTNYWIGYRLAFETRERVRFVVSQEPFATRIESYREEAEKVALNEMPLVLVPAQAKLVRLALQDLGYHYQEQRLSGYDVFSEIAPAQHNLRELDRGLFEVKASGHPEKTVEAVDDNLKTRWGSGQPQYPGMSFVVEFKSPQMLRGLRYDLAEWHTDYPRGLSVELELSSGERRRLFTPEHWSALRYFLEEQSRLEFYFEAIQVKRIILTQLGSDPKFDWSIAELKLFQ